MHAVDTLIRTQPLLSTEDPARFPAQEHAPNPLLGSSGRRHAGEASEREQMLDRLSSLRRVLPALAQEMAAARRQAARLRSDNQRLAEQVRQLRKALESHEGKHP